VTTERAQPKARYRGGRAPTSKDAAVQEPSPADAIAVRAESHKAAGVHHLELWVPDLAEAERAWGWLLTELGWTEYQRWQHGVSWKLGSTYLVVEDSPDRQGDKHDRRRPGLNHVALHVDSPDRVEQLVEAGTTHGWRLLFADRHPYAGGPDHYAAYLENSVPPGGGRIENADGFEVELVAGQPSERAAD
jgi:catechol 2,3-dioxygenase-like lactoylglutathione lyase family enzyme